MRKHTYAGNIWEGIQGFIFSKHTYIVDNMVVFGLFDLDVKKYYSLRRICFGIIVNIPFQLQAVKILSHGNLTDFWLKDMATLGRTKRQWKNNWA